MAEEMRRLDRLTQIPVREDSTAVGVEIMSKGKGLG